MRGFLFKFALSAFLLWLLLRGRDLTPVWDAVKRADRAELALAAACYWSVALPSAARWSMIVRVLGYRLSFGRSLALILIGYFFNQTLLSSIGGDGVRVWKAYRGGLPAVVAVNSALIDRAMQYTAHWLLILAGAVPIFAMIADWRVRSGVLLVLFASAFGLVVAMLADRLPLRPSFPGLPWLRHLADGLRQILLVPRRFAITVGLGLANQLGVFAVVAILAVSLGLPITLVQCLVVVPIATLLTALPISIGGWGVREGAFVIGFGLINIPATDALTLSLVWGILGMVVRLPGGLLWVLMADSALPRLDQMDLLNSEARSSDGISASVCHSAPEQG